MKPKIILIDDNNHKVNVLASLNAYDVICIKPSVNSSHILKRICEIDSELIVFHAKRDNLSVLDEIVRNYKHIPLLIIGEKNKIESRIFSLDHDAFDFIYDPICDEEFKLRVKNLLRIRRAIRNLELQINLDVLTGLPNRQIFSQELSKAIARNKRKNYCFDVLFIDINNFKLINDRIGHLAGDNFLVETKNAIKNNVREYDLICRLGGDEFLVLLRDSSKAENVAVRIVEAIKEITPFDEVGCSIGIRHSNQICPNGKICECPKHIIDDADMAMYQAKQQNVPYMVFKNEFKSECEMPCQNE